MTPIEPGRVLAGRYRLSRRLGEGGMGSVWSAEHIELRSKVAIKLIMPRHASDPASLARFEREARAAAALRSPHVVQILDSGTDDGCAFIVMEELEGEDLAARLERDGCLTPALTASIITHVARAMARAHEVALVHRDLKPGNVFLVQNDDEIVAKVLDFGVAKVRPSPDEASGARTDTGALVGSPFYMSPEQARGRSDVDWRSDLWSLGVVAFECLVGRRPFDGSSLGDIIMSICHDPPPVPTTLAAVPPGFDAWFARATQRDPARRFQSAKELAAELRVALAQGGSSEVATAGDEPAPASPKDGQVTLPPPPSGLPAPTASAPAGEPLGVTTTGGTSGSRSPAAAQGASGEPRRGRAGAWLLLALAVSGAVVASFIRWRSSPEVLPAAAGVSSALPEFASAAPSATSSLMAPPEVLPVPSVSAVTPTASSSARGAPPVASVRSKVKRSAPVPAPTPAPNLLDKRF